LSEKLHLETGLAFNTTRYSCGSFAAAETIPDLYLWGMVTEQDSPIDLLKTRRFMRPLVKVFDTNSFGNIDSDGEINTSLKPEIGWNYELGLKLHGLNNKLYTELTFFSTQITNLLVARRTAEDQYIGINAGVSSHIGMEFC
jgi:iron complex outermembrane receptor protein